MQKNLNNFFCYRVKQNLLKGVKKMKKAKQISSIFTALSLVAAMFVLSPTAAAADVKAIDFGNCNGDSVLDICDLVHAHESSVADITVEELRQKLLVWEVGTENMPTVDESTSAVMPASFTKLNRRSVSGDSHTTVVDENGEKVLKFKRNYASVNTWSGGGIQLKTDDNQFYKLNTSTAYRVKFDYRVDAYSEADDAQFKDLSIMVGVSKQDEGTFTNVRSVTAKDLDTVTAAHRANETATQGRYAAVGARIKKDETDSNWHSVTAEFTTLDSLTTASGTFDILTFSVISNKTNAGDIAVSFKNISIEAPNELNLVKEVSSISNATTTKTVDADDSSKTMFEFSGSAANAKNCYGFFALKDKSSNIYEIAPSNKYKVRFKYKIKEFTKPDDDSQSKARIVLMGYDSDGAWSSTIREVTTAVHPNVTGLGDLFNEIDKNDSNSALIPQITASEADNGWVQFEKEITTKDSLQNTNGWYFNDLGIMVFAGALGSDVTAKDNINIKVDFKEISIENISDKGMEITAVSSGSGVTYQMNAFNTGNYKNVTETGLYIGTAACTLDGIDDMLLKYGTKLTKTPNSNYLVNELSQSVDVTTGYVFAKGYVIIGDETIFTDTYIYDAQRGSLKKKCLD